MTYIAFVCSVYMFMCAAHIMRIFNKIRYVYNQHHDYHRQPWA